MGHKDFLETYSQSHQHPVNQKLHLFGIPIIVLSLLLFPFYWRMASGLFLFGWFLQFLGHLFEGKAPSFTRNPVYLLVGPYWWFKKVSPFVVASWKADYKWEIKKDGACCKGIIIRKCPDCIGPPLDGLTEKNDSDHAKALPK